MLLFRHRLLWRHIFITGQRRKQAIPGAAIAHGIYTTNTVTGRTRMVAAVKKIAPLGIDEATKMCNSFVLVLKPNGKMWLCLNPVRINQAFIQPVHRGLTVKELLPKLAHEKYLTHIDAMSYYHNVKLSEKSLYIATFSCQCSRLKYKWLQFQTALAGDISQRKIGEIFRELPDVIYIADDILIVGHDGNSADHDKTLCRVLQICRKENLKLNKSKCNFRSTTIPVFGEIISRHGLRPNVHMLQTLKHIPHPKSKKELHTF